MHDWKLKALKKLDKKYAQLAQVETTDVSTLLNLKNFSTEGTGHTTIEADELFEFHNLWYKALNGHKYNIDEKTIEEWRARASQLGTNILTDFQLALKNWYVMHDYHNKELMFEKRMEAFTNPNYDPDFVADNYKSLSDVINDLFSIYEIDVKKRYKSLYDNINEDVVRTIIKYVWGNDYSPLSESYDEETENYEYSDEEYSKIASNPDYLVSKFKDYIDNFGLEYFFSENSGISSTLVNNSAISSWIAKSLADFADDIIQRWDNNKVGHPRGSGSDFYDITDLVGQQLLRNEEALNTDDLNKIASAISLSLNLEHNFGNLIGDHSSNLSKSMLDDLSNMDMTEAENELKELGYDTTNIYDEELKNPKYTRDFNLQHPYYKQKESDRIKSIMERNPDKTPQELESLIRPYRGANTDWRDKLVNILGKNELSKS